MSIDVHEADGVVVIRPNQARIIAASGESELGSALAKAIDDGGLAIALDLAGVEYADNAVIGGLVDSGDTFDERRHNRLQFGPQDGGCNGLP